MARFKAACSNCGKAYLADESRLGKKAKCACGATFIVEDSGLSRDHELDSQESDPLATMEGDRRSERRKDREQKPSTLRVGAIVGGTGILFVMFALVATVYLSSHNASITSIKLQVMEIQEELDVAKAGNRNIQEDQVPVLEVVVAQDKQQLEHERRVEKEHLRAASAILTVKEKQRIADLKKVIELGQLDTLVMDDMRFAFDGLGAPVLRNPLIAAVEQGADRRPLDRVSELVDTAELTTEQALTLVTRRAKIGSILLLAEKIRNGTLPDDLKPRIRNNYPELLPLLIKYAE